MRNRLMPAVAAAVLLAGCGSAAHSPAGPVTAGTPAATPANPVPPTGTGASRDCATSPASSPGSSTLTGIQFVSPSRGWAVGGSRILATSNGGASWTVQDRGQLDLLSLDFISGQAGWAVGASKLLFTDDGGRHWRALPEPCPVIRTVHFVSARVGFAIAGGSASGWTSGIGAVVLTTVNGGQSWQRLAAPANPQGVCFSGTRSGWLGAGGMLYSSSDGGHTWTLQSKGAGRVGGGAGVMSVQCADGAAWALEVGPGAAMSQEPHVGFHAEPGQVVPIFAEQYFPHPGVHVQTESPGSYAGPMSAVSATTAVFVDWCPACGWGTAPWAVATSSGAVLTRKGSVGVITEPAAASFITPSLGWVVGVVQSGRGTTQRIVSTDNGGASWHVQYSAG
jgi:hypothetical protein